MEYKIVTSKNAGSPIFYNFYPTRDRDALNSMYLKFSTGMSSKTRKSLREVTSTTLAQKTRQTTTKNTSRRNVNTYNTVK